MPLKLIRDKGGLKIDSGPALLAGRPHASSQQTVKHGKWMGTPAHASRMRSGTIDLYERVVPAKPTIEQLKELVGTYISHDAETTITLAIEGGALVLKRRPDTALSLTPIYRDAFNSQLGIVIFRRDRSGGTTELSVVQDRVWDLRFSRQAQPAARLAD